MAIRSEEYNGVWVLSLGGDLAADEAAALRALFEERLAAALPMNAVVDMEKCAYLDSAALEALLFARRTCDSAGGRLSLANLDGNCRKVLELTRLARHFEFHSNLAGALKN